MCLATFVATHSVRKAGNTVNPRSPRVLDGKYAITTRRRRAVVRTFPYVTADTQDETSAYAYLILYLPHGSAASLESLIGRYGTAVAALEACWNDLAPEGQAMHARLARLADEQAEQRSADDADAEEGENEEIDLEDHMQDTYEQDEDDDADPPMEIDATAPTPPAAAVAAPTLSSTANSADADAIFRWVFDDDPVRRNLPFAWKTWPGASATAPPRPTCTPATTPSSTPDSAAGSAAYSRTTTSPSPKQPPAHRARGPRRGRTPALRPAAHRPHARRQRRGRQALPQEQEVRRAAHPAGDARLLAIGSRVRITHRIQAEDGADLGLVPNTFGYVETLVYDNSHGPVAP